jgi:hypothetical protein
MLIKEGEVMSPWTPESFKKKHNKSLSTSQATKGSRVANAFLREGGSEGKAIRLGNWVAKHGNKGKQHRAGRHAGGGGHRGGRHQMAGAERDKAKWMKDWKVNPEDKSVDYDKAYEDGARPKMNLKGERWRGCLGMAQGISEQ